MTSNHKIKDGNDEKNQKKTTKTEIQNPKKIKNQKQNRIGKAEIVADLTH